MTDTNHIEQRARELLAAECDRTVEGMHYDAYGVVTLHVALSAIRRALSARASAGEAVEIIEDAIKLASDGVTFGCPADVADWMRDALVAAPQPAQAGASGGGEVEIAEIMRGCLSAIEGGRDPRYGFSIGPSIEGIEEAAKRIAAMLTPPASPATGGDPPFVDDKITIADVAGVLGEMAENFDGGEYTISEETRCVLIDFAHGITQHDLFSIIEYHFKQKYATPQPESAGEWDSFDERAVKFAVHPQQATCKDSLQVPPAHGDGEGNIAETWAKVCIALNEVDPNWMDHERDTEWDAALAAVNAIRRLATTRPSPEAQEVRDGVDARRYRYLRDHCKREWYSDMPHNKGAPSLDIEFEARGHDLDAAIDAALALPAQGVGK